MKNITWIICLLALSSCKKNDNAVVVPTNSYSNTKGIWIKVDSTQWYLTRLYNGGEVHVKLNGTTNADKIAIRTSGDGLLTDNPYPLMSIRVLVLTLSIPFLYQLFQRVLL